MRTRALVGGRFDTPMPHNCQRKELWATREHAACAWTAPPLLFFNLPSQEFAISEAHETGPALVGDTYSHTLSESELSLRSRWILPNDPYWLRASDVVARLPINLVVESRSIPRSIVCVWKDDSGHTSPTPQIK